MSCTVCAYAGTSVICVNIALPCCCPPTLATLLHSSNAASAGATAVPAHVHHSRSHSAPDAPPVAAVFDLMSLDASPAATPPPSAPRSRLTSGALNDEVITDPKFSAKAASTVSNVGSAEFRQCHASSRPSSMNLSRLFAMHCEGLQRGLRSGSACLGWGRAFWPPRQRSREAACALLADDWDVFVAAPGEQTANGVGVGHPERSQLANNGLAGDPPPMLYAPDYGSSRLTAGLWSADVMDCSGRLNRSFSCLGQHHVCFAPRGAL